jgi:zinc protease
VPSHTKLSVAFVSAALAVACGSPPPPQVPPQPSAAKTTPVVIEARPAPAPPAKVRSVEGITEYSLQNGMKLLLVPDGTQSTITVNITYYVGSLFEGYGETGMAHLLEHMTFKGTPNHHNILKLVETRGGHANGTTWNDRTNYFETLAATSDNLDWALRLEADRMLNCTIAADELATEFSVVRNEFEMGENNPTGILDERMTSTAYLWHNYGKNTIGSRADIEHVPVDALRAFYRKYYQPDNAMLVVSGKFEADAALSSVQKIFGVLDKPSRVLAAPYSVEPVQDGERSVTLRRNGDVHVVGSSYHTVGGAAPDYAAVSAAVDILTHKPSGRLYKAIVATKLASSISGADYPFRDPGLATFLSEVRDPKNVAKVREAMVSVVEGLGAAKLEAAELERWRNMELKEFDMLFSDSEKVAIQLSEFAAQGDWRTIFAYRDQVKKTTLADVTRVAKAYFKASNRTLGEFIPTKDADRAPFTTSPDVGSIVKNIESGAGTQQGENFASTLENIEAKTVRAHLKGGLEAAFVPKKNRGGRVHLTMQLHFGDEKTLANKQVVLAMTARMLTRGTTKHTFEELRDAEDKARCNIDIRARDTDLEVDIQGFRDQLPAAIDLVSEMLMTPSFPAKEFEVVRQEALATFEQQLSDPQSLAWIESRKLTSSWPASDPRYTLSPAERIAGYKKVTPAEVAAFHRELLGASHGEVAVIGDFDQAALTSKLESTLGTWAAKKPYARLARKVFDVPGSTKVINVKDKEMAQLVLREQVALRDDSPDYAPWMLLGKILGSDTASRIWMRVREKEGLSYGAGAYMGADSIDEVGETDAQAIVAPQNADKALASILDEYKKAATGAVTAEELARVKGAWTKELDTNLSNDRYVAGLLAEGLFLKRTLAWTNDLRAKINAVTADDIARVAKKYLHPEKLVVIKAGDFSKQPEAPKK